MILNGSFTRLISLVLVLSVLYQRVDSTWSPTAQAVFESINSYPQEDFIQTSKTNYGNVEAKIQESVTNGNFIHIQDAEGDDILHDMLTYLGGHKPSQVYLAHGYHLLRKHVTERYWKHLAVQGSDKPPEIFTLHGGRSPEDFAAFDKSEGAGMLTEDEIKKYQDDSLEPYSLDQAIEQGRNALRKTLSNNDFTTIVLKTAPKGIVDILAQFNNKIAIVWTGPLRKQFNSNSWGTKFNYFRGGATDDSNKLIRLNIPTVIAGPYDSNARMAFIVDKIFRKSYIDPQPYLHNSEFPGFDNLAVPKARRRLMSQYTTSVGRKLMDQVIFEAADKRKEYDAMKIDGVTEEALAAWKVNNLSLTERWEVLRQSTKITEDGHEVEFHELCPVDPIAVVVTDKTLSESVQEVLQVKVLPPDNNNQVHLAPDENSNIFLISQLDSTKLAIRIQEVITWMAHGEESFTPGRFYSDSTSAH